MTVTTKYYLTASFLWIFTISRYCSTVYGCQFYPAGEYLRFVRVPENTPLGAEVIQIEVHPRRNLSLQPVDKVEDVEYFKFRPVNRSIVSVRLARSLEDLVDGPNPQSVLKFRMVCDFDDGDDTISSYLSVSVYVEDVNDNGPVFLNSPYVVKVDELTATGSAVFNNILAIDRDKTNTPNSDIHYTIIGGNEKAKFSLEDNNPASILLSRPLDYDTGDVSFVLTILASDRGVPQRNSTTTVTITVNDNDDLNPKFTKDVYKTQISEFYPSMGKRIHQELQFIPPIHAEDQDHGINAPIRYDITGGENRQLFHMDTKNGSLFLEHELDLDELKSNVFMLHIQATQVDNPLKYDISKVQVEVLDINDNLPQFEVDIYNISIVENLPNGFSVLQVIANDRDQGDNAEFVYHLVDPSQAFTIDGKSGWLSVRNQAKLDREQRSTLSMRVYAREKLPSVINGRGLENSEPFVTVEVTLLDANDNNPTFVPSNVYDFTIPSDAVTGFIVGKVEATDPDLGGNGQIRYSIQKNHKNTSFSNDSPDDYFDVDPLNGNIIISNRPLVAGRYTIFLEATDQPSNPTERRFALAVVTIHILAQNRKSAPEFIGAPYEFWVGNDVPVGTSIGQIRVEGVNENQKLLYDLLHSYHEGVPFAVEERSGTISVVDEMSKFDRSFYQFEAVAANEKSLTLSANVTVHVVDSESSALSFRNNEPVTVSFRVRENQSGALVGQIGRRTQNFGNNIGHIPYHLNSTDMAMWRNERFVIVNQPDIHNKFAVSPDGTIYTQQPLDREERSHYQLIIFAESGKRVIRSLYHVNITVEDENDNAPVFDHDWYEGYVKESSVVGTEIRMDNPLKITDADSGLNSHFTLSLRGNGSEFFSIDQKNKKLTVRDGVNLDREIKDKFILRVVAKDRGNLSSEAKITIHIEDINDHSPRFVQMVVHHREGVEIWPPLKNKTRLYLKNNTDHVNSSKEKESPTIIIPETLPIGIAAIRLRAVDDDIGENADISYSVLSETYIPESNSRINTYTTPHFTIHPVTGEVTIASLLPPETDFVLNVSATDKGGLDGHTSIKIHIKDINNNAPQFSKSWYDYSIPEGTYSNHVISKLYASDDDYGQNGNISYSIVHKRDHSSNFPFKILPDGTLLVNGELDRENQEFYPFRVKAEDHGPPDKRLYSMVDIDVRVSDLNDNYPIFYNNDKIIKFSETNMEEKKSVKKDFLVPVYKTSVIENSGSGIPIVRVYANDSDLPANGNGMVLFHIPHKRNQRELFAIDSKEGVITTLVSLDFENEPAHNITVLASDLGKPSLTSTALVMVHVVDVQETTEEISSPIFAHRYYEMEVEENCAIPMNLLALNVSAEYNRRFGNLRFSIIPDGQSHYFKVNPINGSIQLVKSPDREIDPLLQVKIKVDRVSKRGKSVQMIYPLQSDSLSDIAANEVKVIVHVLDENDNAPAFRTDGKPLIIALPNTATYGYPVTKLKAVDPDAGINAEIRYQIVARHGENPSKFIIDSTTGQIKAAGSFVYDAGEVFTFDVKAIDRAGADDGKVSVATVYVFVVDEQSKVMLIAGAKPNEIEANMRNITEVLSDISGFDVRVKKIEPHYEKSTQNIITTDLHLYAVDTISNSIVDNEIFSQTLKEKEPEIREMMEPYQFLAIASSSMDNEIKTQRSEKTYISGLEVMSALLGCVIFLGILTAVVCVACFNCKRSKYENGSALFPPLDPTDMPFSLYTGTKSIAQLSACRPRSLFNPMSFVEDQGDSYTHIDCHRQRRSSYHHGQSCETGAVSKNHSDKCRSRSMGGLLGASMMSLHSSEKDSGIEAAHKRRNGTKCQCKHSALFSSVNSSNGSYEDSLKSLQPQHTSSGSDSDTKHNRQLMPNFSRFHKELSGNQHRMRQSMSRLNC